MNDNLEQPEKKLESEEDILASVRAEAEAMKAASAQAAEQPEPVANVETKKEDKVSSEESKDAVPSTDVNPVAEANSGEQPADDKPVTFKEPITLKSRNLTISVNNMDELIKIAEQGLDYTKKTQELAPYRKTIEFVKAAGIDDMDLQLLADIKAGNKTAINGFAQKYGIDLDAHDSDAPYRQQAVINTPNEVDYVANEILANEKLANEFRNVIQYTPDSFKAQMAQDANIMRAFAQDVERGLAQKIIPEANKIVFMNPGMDFMTAYIQADRMLSSQAATAPQQAVANNVPAQPQQPQVAQPKVVSNASADAKAKASIGSKAGATPDNSLDIWENGLSDAELIRRIQEQANKLKNKG